MRTCIGMEQQTLANELLRLFHSRCRGSLIQSSALTYEAVKSAAPGSSAKKNTFAAKRESWSSVAAFAEPLLAIAVPDSLRVDIAKSWIFFLCLVLTLVVTLASTPP